MPWGGPVTERNRRDGRGLSRDETKGGLSSWGQAPLPHGPVPYASACFAAASIAASDLRTWFGSVVNQKSGIEAFR